LGCHPFWNHCPGNLYKVVMIWKSLIGPKSLFYLWWWDGVLLGFLPKDLLLSLIFSSSFYCLTFVAFAVLCLKLLLCSTIPDFKLTILAKANMLMLFQYWMLVLPGNYQPIPKSFSRDYCKSYKAHGWCERL